MKNLPAIIALILVALASGFVVGQSTNTVVVASTTTPPPAQTADIVTFPAGNPKVAYFTNTLIPAIDPNAATETAAGKNPVQANFLLNTAANTVTVTVIWE